LFWVIVFIIVYCMAWARDMAMVQIGIFELAYDDSVLKRNNVSPPPRFT